MLTIPAMASSFSLNISASFAATSNTSSANNTSGRQGFRRGSSVTQPPAAPSSIRVHALAISNSRCRRKSYRGSGVANLCTARSDEGRACPGKDSSFVISTSIPSHYAPLDVCRNASNTGPVPRSPAGRPASGSGALFSLRTRTGATPARSRNILSLKNQFFRARIGLQPS